MSFPRRAGAGQIQEGTFRGCNLAVCTKRGPYSVEMMVDGTMRSIDHDGSAEENIEQLKDTINAAMRTALGYLKRHWFEYGMSLKHALDLCPLLEVGESLQQQLRQQLLPFIGESYAIDFNAVPEVLRMRTDAEGEQEEMYVRFLEDMSAGIGSAFGMRAQLLNYLSDRDPLQRDLESYHWLYEELGKMSHGNKLTFDDNRLCILMPVGRGGQKHFINSLGYLIQQANQAGKKVDVLLGLNQVDYPHEVDTLRGGNVRVINLYVNEETSNGFNGRDPFLLSEDVFTAPDCTGEKFIMHEADPDWNRVLAIRQQKTSWNAGKNPLQGVMTRMLFDRLALTQDAKLPAQILLADADAWFMEQPKGRACARGDLQTNGLSALLSEKERRNLAMLGARGRSARYDVRAPGGEKIPDFDAPIPDIYRLLDASAEQHIRFMPGGGTLGNFKEVLALLALICHRYPGSRTEDMHYTILAEHAGIPWGVSEDACVSNEVHGDSLDQPRRWFSGAAGLRTLYGSKVFRGITNASQMRSAFAGPEWEHALAQYEELIAHGKAHPDDVRHGDASWNA